MFSKEYMKKLEGIKQEWNKEFEKYYKGKKYPLSTDSGIELKPVYTAEDVKDTKIEKSAMPGVYPYTRGTYPLIYQTSMWTTQQGMGYGTPEETRARYDLLIKEGLGDENRMVPQYFILPDAVVQEGYDPDHPSAKKQVGVVGCNWSTTEDMKTLFHDLPLDEIGVVFASFDPSPPTLAMYQVAAERMGFSADKLRGHTVANFYRQTCWDMRSFPPESAFKIASEYFKYCSENIPLWSTISYQGYGFQEAGATPVQELAFMTATAIAFTDATIKLGLHADDFVSRYGFVFSIDDDFFEAIAKMRAFRRMWAKITKERWGCKKTSSSKAIIQTKTAGISMTAQQPLNNIVRAGIQTLAAVLGGATSIWTTHYDEAFSIPSEEAATLCLRTQQMIYHETNVAKVVDPLGGSYYLEWLTDKMEEEATSLMEKIEEMGYENCWRDGWFRRELEKSAYEWKQNLESGESIKVGVNKYKLEEEVEINLHSPNPESEEIMISRVQEFREKRDFAKTEAALKEFRKAAEEVRDNWPDASAELMPPLVETIRADATLGESMGILKEVFGWSNIY